MSYFDGDKWKLNVKQWRSVIESTSFINLWEGAIRSGKTFSTLVRWLVYIAYDAPAGNLIMTGVDQNTIYRNLIQPLEEYAPSVVKYKQGTHVCWIWGRPVFVIGAKDQASEKKIRGMTLAGALVDELTILPQNFWILLQGRISKGGGKIFATTNPDSPQHWLMTDYINSPVRASHPEWFKSWHFDLDDNHTITEEQKNNIKLGYTGLWYKRFILGLWVQAAGAVYDMIDENKHILPAEKMPEEYDQFYIGVDFGTSSVTCFVMVGRIKDKYYVVKEKYYDARVGQREWTVGEAAREFWNFKGNLKVSKIVVDPSASTFRAELGIGEEIYHPDQEKMAINAVVPGIQTVAKLFAQDRLFICRDWCKNTVKELMGYTWDEKSQQSGIDAPVKLNDHTCDALRYAIAWSETPLPLANTNAYFLADRNAGRDRRRPPFTR